MFEDCLRHAKVWAEKNSMATDKPIKKNKAELRQQLGRVFFKPSEV